MLEILPFIAWLAALTSSTLLFVLWKFGDLKRRSLAALVGWFMLAGYCQFFGSSAVISAAGLVLQTVLAICLMIRWKVS